MSPPFKDSRESSSPHRPLAKPNTKSNQFFSSTADPPPSTLPRDQTTSMPFARSASEIHTHCFLGPRKRSTWQGFPSRTILTSPVLSAPSGQPFAPVSLAPHPITHQHHLAKRLTAPASEQANRVGVATCAAEWWTCAGCCDVLAFCALHFWHFLFAFDSQSTRVST